MFSYTVWHVQMLSYANEVLTLLFVFQGWSRVAHKFQLQFEELQLIQTLVEILLKPAVLKLLIYDSQHPAVSLWPIHLSIILCVLLPALPDL